MKAQAAVLERVGGPFVIEEIELAEPIGREVLVEVRAIGLCQTDMSLARTNASKAPMPAVLGHEVAGVVTRVGPDATEHSLGDRVVGCLVTHCGHCGRCRRGKPYACRRPEEDRRGKGERPRVTRKGRPVTQFFDLGGFAERVLTHENNLVAVGPAIPFDRAALLGCGVVTGAGAVRNSAALQPGDTIAVIGCGGVGLSAIQGALLAGAQRIITVDLHQVKLELAKKLGATDVVNPSGAMMLSSESKS